MGLHVCLSTCSSNLCCANRTLAFIRIFLFVWFESIQSPSVFIYALNWWCGDNKPSNTTQYKFHVIKRLTTCEHRAFGCTIIIIIIMFEHRRTKALVESPDVQMLRISKNQCRIRDQRGASAEGDQLQLTNNQRQPRCDIRIVVWCI